MMLTAWSLRRWLGGCAHAGRDAGGLAADTVAGLGVHAGRRRVAQNGEDYFDSDSEDDVWEGEDLQGHVMQEPDFMLDEDKNEELKRGKHRMGTVKWFRDKQSRQIGKGAEFPPWFHGIIGRKARVRRNVSTWHGRTRARPSPQLTTAALFLGAGMCACNG